MKHLPVFRLRPWAALAGAALLVGCPAPAEPPPPNLIADPPPGDGAPPGAGLAELDRGRGFVEAEAWDQAETELEAAVKADPSSAEAHYLLGLTKMMKQDLGAAEAALKEAVELDGTLLEPRARLAEVHLMAEPPNAKGAIAALAPAMDALGEPKDDQDRAFFADLHQLVAFAYRADEQWDKSKKHYQASLELEDSTKVRFDYADMLFSSGDGEAAGRAMAKLLPAFADDLKTTVALGHRLRKVKAYDACLTAFGNALKKKPKEPALLMFRGHCHHGREDEEAARKDYTAALEADAGFQPAYYYLGKSWLVSKRRNKAVGFFRQAIKMDRNSAVGKKAQEELDELSGR